MHDLTPSDFPRRPRLWMRRILSRRLVNICQAELKCASECDIIIHYRDIEFLLFVQRSLRILRDLDQANFSSVKKRIRGITEYKEDVSFIAYVTGVFFDHYSNSERLDIGPKWYAAILVRFAMYLRLLDEWGFKDVIKFSGKRYMRLARIATNREISCCENLGCEMKHVYRLKRALAQLNSEIGPIRENR